MAEMAKEFSGLPIQALICEPLIAVAKGQAQLCDVYLQYIYKLAWKDGKQNGETNTIKFNLERPVTNGAGNITKKSYNVEAPLLSLVPVPAFTMSEASVEFTMEVNTQESTTSSVETEATVSVSASYWSVSASITGRVATSLENTRSTDKTAKYVISAKAVQQEPAEGMAKLTDLFASVIEPIDVGNTQ